MAHERFNDDNYLIVRCAGEDAEAWTALTGRYSRLMQIAIRKQLDRYGCPHAGHAVEDILQDALTSIWQDKKMSLLNNVASLPYWLAMCAQNAAISHLRKAGREDALHPIPILERDDGEDTLSGLPACGQGPGEELSRQETAKNIDDAIDSLPPNEKLAVKLHILYGMKQREIADMLGIAKGTVASSIRRGKERLRTTLASYTPGGEK